MIPGTRPVLTETVDARAGVVRLDGHLTPQGADLVEGLIAGLQRSGHRRVLVDASGVSSAEAGARAMLASLPARLAGPGAELRITVLP
jgi:type IV pilus biogenesis protein CpaD/CtpE